MDISVPERKMKILYIYFYKNIVFSDVLLKGHCSERKVIGENKNNFPIDNSKVVFAQSAGYQNIVTRTLRLKNACFDLHDLHDFIYQTYLTNPIICKYISNP